MGIDDGKDHRTLLQRVLASYFVVGFAGPAGQPSATS